MREVHALPSRVSSPSPTSLTPLKSSLSSDRISGLQMAVDVSSAVPLESSVSSGRGSASPRRDARGAVRRAERTARQRGKGGVECGGGVRPGREKGE